MSTMATRRTYERDYERTYDDDAVLTRARALMDSGAASGQIWDLVTRIDNALDCDPNKRPSQLFLKLSNYLQGYPQ